MENDQITRMLAELEKDESFLNSPEERKAVVFSLTLMLIEI